LFKNQFFHLKSESEFEKPVWSLIRKKRLLLKPATKKPGDLRINKKFFEQKIRFSFFQKQIINKKEEKTRFLSFLKFKKADSFFHFTIKNP